MTKINIPDCEDCKLLGETCLFYTVNGSEDCLKKLRNYKKISDRRNIMSKEITYVIDKVDKVMMPDELSPNQFFINNFIVTFETNTTRMFGGAFTKIYKYKNHQKFVSATLNERELNVFINKHFVKKIK